MEFKKGIIVKSKNRTIKVPLILMVLDDYILNYTQFNAVVLFDRSNEYEVGMVSNNWNKTAFMKSNVTIQFIYKK